ncbi:hypothetical protein KIN20_019062 [Parelaphostrongylus tenuis]|uniref:ABC transporter domain-containing protein n=1 Tax=Parelaphostrongylus tenuis TaxID=148309 RepID=A0AAD5MKC5_PARTN|nr:hypothetical protein KIN20_019062 [Parelaphostrongylus tenuis]
MPKDTTKDERKETVEDVLLSMGLISCRSLRIDSSTKKSISRSERKRLAFASEIITNPSILFCEEPTSGLDSFMALEVNPTCAIYRSTATMQLDRLIYPATVP